MVVQLIDTIRKVDNSGVISTVVIGLPYPIDVSAGLNDELLIIENYKQQITKIDNNGKKVIIVGTQGLAIGDFRLPDNAPLALVSSVSVLSDTDLIVTIWVVQPNHTCDGISNKNSTVCSGNGYCVATDACRCKLGYTGIVPVSHQRMDQSKCHIEKRSGDDKDKCSISQCITCDSTTTATGSTGSK